MKRIFSGIQPTGNLHLGNYLGAIRNWVDPQEGNECLYCIVNLHAITVWWEPDELRASTREVTAGLIVAGIDPVRNIVVNQSQNPDHATLTWIFNCVARLGWLNRFAEFFSALHITLGRRLAMFVTASHRTILRRCDFANTDVVSSVPQ